MTKEFAYLMHLVAAAGRGDKAELPSEDIDWNTLASLAREQSLEPLVGYGLKLSPDVPCPDPLREDFLGKMRRLGAYEVRRRKLVMQLMEALEAEGISTVLLKGYSVGSCYAAPECRVSSDTDLLIRPKDEGRACNFLEGQGFHVRARSKNSHHTECTHPTIGMVELHVSLYDEIVEDIWFGGVREMESCLEPRRRRECSDGVYHTLGETDELIFLMLHTAKHFIFSGMSLRQILDVAMFYEKNRDAIETERFWNVMEKLRLKQLSGCILWAAVKYLGFSTDDFPGINLAPPMAMGAVLDDLEKGGWLGHNERHAREDGWVEYTRQIMLKERSQASYERYMLRRRFSGIWRRIFPSRASLAEHFPEAGKNVLYVPWAWLRVSFGKLRRLLGGSATRHIVADGDELSTTGRERLRIFSDLGMI